MYVQSVVEMHVNTASGTEKIMQWLAIATLHIDISFGSESN